MAATRAVEKTVRLEELERWDEEMSASWAFAHMFSIAEKLTYHEVGQESVPYDVKYGGLLLGSIVDGFTRPLFKSKLGLEFDNNGRLSSDVLVVCVVGDGGDGGNSGVGPTFSRGSPPFIKGPGLFPSFNGLVSNGLFAVSAENLSSTFEPISHCELEPVTKAKHGIGAIGPMVMKRLIQEAYDDAAAEAAASGGRVGASGRLLLLRKILGEIPDVPRNRHGDPSNPRHMWITDKQRAALEDEVNGTTVEVPSSIKASYRKRYIRLQLQIRADRVLDVVRRYVRLVRLDREQHRAHVNNNEVAHRLLTLTKSGLRTACSDACPDGCVTKMIAVLSAPLGGDATSVFRPFNASILNSETSAPGLHGVRDKGSTVHLVILQRDVTAARAIALRVLCRLNNRDLPLCFRGARDESRLRRLPLVTTGVTEMDVVTDTPQSSHPPPDPPPDPPDPPPDPPDPQGHPPVS